MKKYLLIVGENYYPCSGTDDWIGCFETYEEALSQFKQDGEYGFIWYNGKRYDWYDIINLEEWINPKTDG